VSMGPSRGGYGVLYVPVGLIMWYSAPGII